MYEKSFWSIVAWSSCCTQNSKTLFLLFERSKAPIFAAEIFAQRWAIEWWNNYTACTAANVRNVILPFQQGSHHQWSYMWVLASIGFRCMYWYVWCMYGGMYWYVLTWYVLWHVLVCIILVCITCIGKYWYVFRGHMCKYSYVLVSIGMYGKMVLHCTYWYVLICIGIY